MLRSDLCDFSDAYIVVKGRVTASFNPRANYVSNDFPINLFLFSIFPRRSSAIQIIAARNAAITNAVNAANAADDRRNLIKGISFRNNAPFIKCISKINGTLINNADLVMLQCQCKICLSTVKITQKQQAVCGIIIEMNRVVTVT